MAEVYDVISSLLRQGEDIMLARVIDDRGSAPRGAGACMVIRKNGEITGTVGGGLIEAETMKMAARLFPEKRPATLSFDMTGDVLADGSMVCGGRVELLIDHVSATSDNLQIFETIVANRRNNRKTFLISSVPGRENGTGSGRWLLSAGDDPAGSEEAGDEILTVLKDNVRSLAGPALVELEGRRYWIDVIVNGGTVFIFGAGHISREVAALASRVGFNAVVLDDREEFASRERFENTAEVVVLSSFDNCFEGLQLDDNSYVVIVTRGHMYDKQVLAQALRTRAGYIGMIGSARKKDTIYKALLEEGFSSRQLEKVHCPIGIKIETETPEEIAVSIVGELIDVRAGIRQWKKQASRL